jgi:hypothetical protein
LSGLASVVSLASISDGGRDHQTIGARLTARQISPQIAVKVLPLPINIPAFDVRHCWHERYHDDPVHR